MGKQLKTNGYADIHVRIPEEIAEKFYGEADTLGRKITTHFQKILEERYQPKGK